MNRILVALSAVCLPMLSVAAPPITEPVDVKVTNPVLPVEVSNADPIPVNVTNQLLSAQPALPAGAFSVADLQQNRFGPKPGGTHLAITSVTFSNPGSTASYVTLVALAGTTTDCVSFSGPITASVGPKATIPANSTVHLDFPQPFVFPSGTGSVCLSLVGAGAANPETTVVGYSY